MSLLALQSLEPGKVCAKRWRAGGEVEAYGSIVWWRPLEAPGVRNIDQLASALQRLAQRTDLCVVRGTLVDASATRIRRAVQGEHAGLRDGDRSWLCCDLDTLAPPDELRAELLTSPSGGIDAAGRWARSMLPAWLQDVTIVAQWSQSAGRDGYRLAKLHLWAWLDRPVCCASLTEWARDIDVLDPAVCRTVQPIYTSDPIIEDGWTSGPTRRIAVIRGRVDAATPPAEVVDLATWEARRRAQDKARAEQAERWAEANRYRSPAARASRDARRMHGCTQRALDEMATAPESRRHGTLTRCAASIARTAAELGMDPTDDLRMLQDIAVARLPASRAAEPGAVIEYVRRSI